ncbi:M28 family peptidase [Granulicella sp. dw_53]|uniref:M28 family peptidase n=1 Tax=Granulicella sp. dw_53 TaxID=2719792 RepID=UPI001BD6444E|nr:M28 family peptidase [Granulicella sp. dw_53]
MKKLALVLGLTLAGGAGSLKAQDPAAAAPTTAAPTAASSSAAATSTKHLLATAEASIDPEKIRAHVKFLSDDLLEGRGPGLRGAEIAAQYIATQFALYGLKPGGDNGTYLQQINFVGMNAIPSKTKFTLVPGKGKAIDLSYADDYTVSNPTLTASVDVNAPIVFVGYGVTAPEFAWNDYAGVDVKGKVILCIVGDPPSDDPSFFGGRAMTYYGRWTYKFEQAARMGAVGALIIHRTDLASYGWDVVKNSNTSEKTYLRDDENPRVQAASWIQLEIARKLFAAGGMNLDEQMTAAGRKGFKAVELPVRLRAHVESVVRPFQSANVVGILAPPTKSSQGKPAVPAIAVKDQAILYTAHYDHLGFVPGMAGDNIYNGAVDNATGCGMLLEMARAWAASGLKVPHSVIFAAVTAEEQGLLGSEYLGQHPPLPASEIALDINYDMILPIGVPRQINVNGAQRTNFFPIVEATAHQFQFAIVPDPRPEAGSYYRSDHFSLSRVGIPAFSVETGVMYEGHDEAWGRAKINDYEDHDYHNFSDNYHPDWDFAGNAKLDRFGMELGWRVITTKKAIAWKTGDEFEAARKNTSH